MSYTIPNEADAFNINQAEPDKVDFDIILAGHDRTGVVSGCAVTAQGTPDMTVAVASGTVTVEGTEAGVSAGNVNITAADGTNPRLDLIVSNNSGTLSATAGTAAAEPVFPSVPASSAVLAAVYVPANDTTIANNQIIDKRVIIRAAAAGGDPTPFLITPASRLSIGVELAAMGLPKPTSSAYQLANRAILVPFVLMEEVTVVKLFVFNGGTVSGNVDVGIYDASYNRLVSAGSTAQTGTGRIQEFDVGDTTIGPGQFYMAMAPDNTNGHYIRWPLDVSVDGGEMLGLLEDESAFPLPDPLVPIAFDNSTILPIFGLSLRTLVA